MSIAYEFFKDESAFTKGMEDSIIFFIENYGEFLHFYRVMVVQHQMTKEKKEHAHKKLQALRRKVEKLKKQKRELNDAEKLDIEEKTAYFTALREEDDMIYYNGEPMEYNDVTTIILRYQKLFKRIESIDRISRTKSAPILKKAADIVMWPLSKMLDLTIDQTVDDRVLTTLKDVDELVKDFPSLIERSIMNSMDIDVNKHLPPNKKV